MLSLRPGGRSGEIGGCVGARRRLADGDRGCYCAVRPVAAWRWQRPTQPAEDLTHVLMGLAMAAMIEQWLARPWTGVLAAVFLAGAMWFGLAWLGEVRSGAGWVPRRARDRGCGYPMAHALACGVMVIMLLATAGVGAAAAPALAFGLVLALACSLIFAVGRLAPSPAEAMPGGSVAGGSVAGDCVPGDATVGQAAATTALAPRLAGCCQIVMGAAMIWMLLPLI